MQTRWHHKIESEQPKQQKPNVNTYMSIGNGEGSLTGYDFSLA